MSLPQEPVSPTATPLPPIPKEDPLTPAQWKTLLAILDTVIPAIKPMSTAVTQTELGIADAEYNTTLARLTASNPPRHLPADQAIRDYLADNATNTPASQLELQRMFAVHMSPDQRKGLLMILNVLDTRAGSLALTGYLTPISEQPAHIREAILQGWATARLGPLRLIQRSLITLAKVNWVKTSPTLHNILGMPRVPTGMKPGKGYDYEFLQIPPGDAPEVIETDVVVVGSGCGAGVVAKNLAEAGHRVLVVERAYSWTPDHYPMTEKNAFNHLYMNGGGMQSDEGTIGVLAAQAWGGGGTVNWSASLQTQGFVRSEWAARGLPFFTSAEFQDSLDRVCNRMGVSTDHIKHNRGNEVLLEGARKLGWSHKAVPQNTGGNEHACGHCTLGCGSCEKQGPTISYLPDAARAGAKFIEGFDAEEIVFSQTGSKKVATGVRGTWASRDINGGVAGDPVTRRKVLIQAKRVIVSGGTMQSPLLLLRSGLRNPHIGRNLHLHPVSLVGGIHKEEVNPWDGAILTALVSEYENLDGKGHGAKIEAMNMVPSIWMLSVPWKSGLEFKVDAARMRHTVGLFSIARDRDTGRVYPDPTDGRVRVSYSPSKFDKNHILEGVLGCAKIHYVTGAQEIFCSIPGTRPFIRDESASSSDGINDKEFRLWLDEIRANGFPAPQTSLGSAHQMGTCRMSAYESGGVVDPQGKVWGTEGLFVADASVFPSASGVNPMVTNMAISDYISRGVAKGLEEKSRL